MPAPIQTASSAPTSRGDRTSIIRLIDHRNGQTHKAEFARAVRSGLLAKSKTLPCSYFYDEEGSRLFEAICELPEYYVTRTEDALLRDHAARMTAGLQSVGRSPDPVTIVELGSGSATKTRRLLASALDQYDGLRYVPIDVSPSALEDSTRRLARRFPRLQVTGYVADYQQGLERIAHQNQSAGPRLIVFLGSSIGNDEWAEAVKLLTLIARTMRPEDRFLLGTDMAKGREILEAAYDDDAGVTAAFNLNLLTRINRELGADFAVGAFDHRAYYFPDRGRVEMHLVSRGAQTVRIPAAELTVSFEPGESIHTENSHKYTREQLSVMAEEAGFVEEGSWTDSQAWFQLQRWRLRE